VAASGRHQTEPSIAQTGTALASGGGSVRTSNRCSAVGSSDPSLSASNRLAQVRRKNGDWERWTKLVMRSLVSTASSRSPKLSRRSPKA
jgi:hypothetical protein